MTHHIDAQFISDAIDDAEVDVTIDRAVDCSLAGRAEVCAGLLAEDHPDAIKVLLALAVSAGTDSYEQARLLVDRLEVRGRAHGVIFKFPGVIFDGPLTPHDEAGS